MNKIRCPHGISPKGNCDVCLKESREKYIKRYHQSIEYKEYQKGYRQTPKHKEYIRKYMRQYNSKVFNPTPAKPESPSKPDTDITSVNAKTPLFEASQESASPDGKSSTESTQQTETGGRLNSEV
jgi:hypothetical protein